MGHLNIGPVYRVGQVETEYSSKTSLFQETEGKIYREGGILDPSWYCVFRALNTSLYKMLGFIVVTCSFWGEFEDNFYIICLRFITNIINYVTGLAETKKCPQDLTFTKNRSSE